MAKPLRIWIWNSNTIASHIWTDNTNDLGLNKITTRLFSSLSGHATSTKMSSKLHANRALARFLLKKFIHEWYIYILLADIGSFWKRSPLGSESSIFCLSQKSYPGLSSFNYSMRFMRSILNAETSRKLAAANSVAISSTAEEETKPKSIQFLQQKPPSRMPYPMFV